MSYTDTHHSGKSYETQKQEKNTPLLKNKNNQYTQNDLVVRTIK